MRELERNAVALGRTRRRTSVGSRQDHRLHCAERLLTILIIDQGCDIKEQPNGRYRFFRARSAETIRAATRAAPTGRGWQPVHDHRREFSMGERPGHRHFCLTGYLWIVVGSAIISWVNARIIKFPHRAFLESATDPIYSRLRRAFPFHHRRCFTPMAVIAVLYFLQAFH